MQVFRQIFSFYLNSSIHVALSVGALTVISSLQFNLEANTDLIFFVIFATITAYNFIKYFGLAKFHHRSLATWLRAIQVFSFVSFIAMCYFLMRLQFSSILALLPFGVITFLYAIPLLPKRYFRNEQMQLRQISGLKIYVIALVWVFTTVSLPFMEHGLVFNADIFIYALQRYILVIVITLPFEIRDLKYDSLKLATIPQKIGIRATKQLGILLLVCYFLMDFLKDDINQQSIFYSVVIVMSSFFGIVFATPRQSNYYSAFWIEGLPIFWLLTLLVLF